MKVRAIIQARMLSKRLRGKSLMAVNEVPLLYRVIDAVKKNDFIDEITVATTDMMADDPIEAAVNDLKANVFRGDSLNVLKRFVDASNDMDEHDVIVRFTADNPLNYLEVSKNVFDKHIESKADYTHIHGLSHIVPEFINVGALREALELTSSNFDKEHVTPFFRKNLDVFKVLELPNNFDGLRPELDPYLTIDTGEQLEAFEAMFDDLRLGTNGINFQEIYEYLEKKEHRPLISDKLKINLDGINIGGDYPTYIIAEIGQNHNGEVNLAKRLIDMSVDCGANAVKFQKRDIPSELTKEAYEKPYDNPNSFGKTYGEHRMFLELDESQHLELREYASAKGITYFCTPCDVPSVKLMERINCPFYKVASRDLTNIPLLESLGKTNKPVIISTGMASMEDIDTAIETLQLGKDKLIIMQCTSQYPCALENVNLKAMDTLKDKFGFITGFSDHTSGVVISTAAAVMGAPIIEKHVTLDRTMKGTDQPGSLEKAGLYKLVEYIRACELAIGDGIKAVNPVTEASKIKLARSVTSSRNIKKGEVLNEEMICLKSPGDGIKWVNREQVLGKTAAKDIEADSTIREADFQ